MVDGRQAATRATTSEGGRCRGGFIGNGDRGYRGSDEDGAEGDEGTGGAMSPLLAASTLVGVTPIVGLMPVGGTHVSRMFGLGRSVGRTSFLVGVLWSQVLRACCQAIP